MSRPRYFQYADLIFSTMKEMPQRHWKDVLLLVNGCFQLLKKGKPRNVEYTCRVLCAMAEIPKQFQEKALRLVNVVQHGRISEAGNKKRKIR